MAQVELSWPRGDGEMAGRIRAFDWAATPLGPIAGWPQSLKTVVDLMLGSQSMMSLVWGEAAIHLYNDGFTALLREHRALALGRSAFETFARSRDVFESDIAAGMAGRSARLVAQRYPVLRQGRLEEAWFDADYTPIRDETGAVAGVLWTLKETTTQHMAERALRASETRHRLLIESWAQAVWETDANGVVVTDSPTWRAYTGQTREEWFGDGWLDAIHPEDRAHAERQWREAIRARRPVDVEYRLRAPGGGWRWANVRASPVLDAGGTIEKWVGLNIDIDERKQAEAGLRASEEKYRTLFDNIDEGFTVVELIRDAHGRPVDLVYREFNRAFERHSGLTPAVMNRGVREVLPQFNPQWFVQYARILETGVAERIEDYVPDLNRWHRRYMSRIGGPGSPFCAVVFHDITERKHAEIALREREERQAFVLRLSDALRALESPEAVGALAMRMIAVELRLDRCWVCRFSREQGLAWLGPEYGPPGSHAVTGEYLLRDFPETMRQVETASPAVADVRNDPNLTERDRASILGLGMGAYMTTILRRGEQEYVWALCGSTSAPRDWTEHDRRLLDEVTERVWAAMERAHAEAALRESEERFRQFADASAAGLWVREAGTLAMEYASPAIAAIYGIESEDLLGDVTRWAAMIVPEDRDVALRHLEQARAGDVAAHEFRIQRPADGSFRWIKNTDFPLHDAAGRVQRIGGIAQDVTETKLAAEHTSVLLAELQHRVRNIMAMIRSITARTGERAESVPAYAALMAERLHAGVGILGIVRDELAAQAQHEGQYTIEGPDLVLAPKAAEVLTLAVHELTTNALKYGGLSGADGHVTVRWATFERAGSSWLALDWSETGAPTAPDPATPRRRGFGSELIEGRVPYELRGRGRIAIEPGGARCHLEFPLRNGDSILQTDAPQRATVFGGSIDMTNEADLTGRRVLVIEDDYYLATDTARALQGAGAGVLGPCPDEAAARGALADGRPDAAVLDINLGAGPSFKLAETLKDRGIPFVFTTGYDPEVIPAEFDGVARLQKPVQLRQIVAAVSKLLPAA